MIRGVGLDVVETARVARALANYGARFAERVFTAVELADCAGRADRVEALAARFAAKEACLKALGTGWITGLSLRHVEVSKGKDGAPELRLYDAAAERMAERGARRIHVSLSHQPGLAAAVVILED